MYSSNYDITMNQQSHIHEVVAGKTKARLKDAANTACLFTTSTERVLRVTLTKRSLINLHHLNVDKLLLARYM